VRGRVEGHDVAIGSPRYITGLIGAMTDAFDADSEGALDAHVAIDRRFAGIVRYRDRIRPGARVLLDRLADLGIDRTLVLSGDQTRNAVAVGRALGIADVRGDLLPADKVAAVRALVDAGERVAMVGDGTNDAPALSAATVGIALAGHGGGITAEAADVVLLVDEPAAIATVIAISRRTMRIARQSLRIGLGLSGIAMIFATLGHVAPAAGALLQEAIDVGVILNALRTTLSATPPPRSSRTSLPMPLAVRGTR
jgi:P-type E1-E2 ATPase